MTPWEADIHVIVPQAEGERPQGAIQRSVAQVAWTLDWSFFDKVPKVYERSFDFGILELDFLLCCSTSV